MARPVYAFDGPDGTDPHGRIIEISEEDAKRWDEVREIERPGRTQYGRFVSVVDLKTGDRVKVATAPCGAGCHCAAVVVPDKDDVDVVVEMLAVVEDGDARYPLVRNAALSTYGESLVHRAESRLVRKRAEEYGRLCDEARRLGIPTSLDDPETPALVSDLRRAVVDALRRAELERPAQYRSGLAARRRRIERTIPDQKEND